MIDHLVYASPDLDSAVAALADLLGVRAQSGGQHPGKGTRNALLALGPGSYLEIIAPDPDQSDHTGPRWMSVDALDTPRLLTWAASGHDLAARRQRALAHGVPLGPVSSGRRLRGDGVLLHWELTEPEPLIAGGIVPFLIDWGSSPHPSFSAIPGVRLRAFRAEHPDPAPIRAMMQELELPLRIDHALAPALIAILDTPRGEVELR